MKANVTLLPISRLEDPNAGSRAPIEVEIEVLENLVRLTVLSGEKPTAARIVIENYAGTPIAYIWDGEGGTENSWPPYKYRVEMAAPTVPPCQQKDEGLLLARAD